MEMRQIDCRTQILGQHARAPFDRRNPLGTDRLNSKQELESFLWRDNFKKRLSHLLPDHRPKDQGESNQHINYAGRALIGQNWRQFVGLDVFLTRVSVGVRREEDRENYRARVLVAKLT